MSGRQAIEWMELGVSLIWNEARSLTGPFTAVPENLVPLFFVPLLAIDRSVLT